MASQFEESFFCNFQPNDKTACGQGPHMSSKSPLYRTCTQLAQLKILECDCGASANQHMQITEFARLELFFFYAGIELTKILADVRKILLAPGWGWI